ncbi:N-6 DNA methylase [Corynebacterium riegelii]|uniref:site-specific DNA-methyltransferase (adenine-specific) n=1 Tax=Corynebacterium riegelii TaxID=156976 RepID=A0A0K1RAQ4_9CORY|nr:N-6 DNA methylase [Corynebacterium riegelii]AKV58478.1 hypothetical protein AK829_04035 [Corynebacterium riegelii]
MAIDSDLLYRLANPGTLGRTESDIQSDIKMLLLSATDLSPAETALASLVNLEEQLGDGSRRRIDIALGSTVIETKRILSTREEASDYINQLQGYVETRMNQTKSRYNGILSDGRTWWLFEKEPDSGKFPLLSSFELTSSSKGTDLVAWLQAVLAMPAEVPPRPDSIEDALGAESPGYAQDKAFLQSMYRKVANDPTTNLKRQLWARLLRSALGTGFEDKENLFLDHTLLSIEAAAIGHAVMGINLADLSQDPASMLTGEYFRNSGIYNVVEADFFDWVLAVPEGKQFLRQVIRRINMFDWTQTEHDVLKILYESIINAETRKGAGEYYTPDWLAEGIVEKALTKPLEQRALDPSCGSGTFIYHLLRRMIRAGEAAGWDNRSILNHVQEHVFGLDIHPVSVSLARITYLLALGSRLEDERDDIWVPIHLGDSVQWYQPADHDETQIKIRTDGVDLTSASTGAATLFDIGRVLAFPLSGIEDPLTFDRLVSDMTDRAKTCADVNATKPSIDPVLSSFGITDPADRETLATTFDVLCALNAEGRDSIWGYFVRNQVRPLWLSMKNRRVDVLVGNPPWVSYRYMTEDMQEQFKAFSQARNLWHGANVATQQDLVGLFLVRSVEKYLKDGGCFAFVTPYAVLSRMQYDGLRKGDWRNGLYGEFTETWDLSNVRPKNDLFPVPSAVVFGKKNLKPATENEEPSHGFPSTKCVVEGKRDLKGWTATQKALSFTSKPLVSLSANGAEGAASPYRKVVVNGATIFPRMLLFVEERETTGKLGLTRGKKQVQSFRTSLEKEPWKSTPSLSAVLEEKYLHPVHLGATIAPFKLLEPWTAVLPIENGKLLQDQQIRDDAAPGLAEWWKRASAEWEAKKTRQSKLSLLENIDYQSKLSKQLRGSKLRVLYTASGTALAAMYTQQEIIVEHALYWLPVKSISEARYLTGILNAPLTTELVREYQSVGLFGGRHFDTYPWRLAIPTYEAGNTIHEEIVSLCKECESVATTINLRGPSFQKVRSGIRRKLDEEGLSERLNLAVTALLRLPEEN